MTIEQAIYQLTDLIKDRESFCYRDDFDDVFLQDIEALKVGISALESNISVAKGKWIAENSRPKSPMFVCSLCGKKAYDRPYGSAKHTSPKVCKLKYCPNCGAKMEGMSEIIEMPYGNGKALTKEFIKKYEEVQLDVKVKTRECFVNAHCSYDCPNFQIDTANEKYGYGIADDIGLEEISCKHCYYNSGRCEDCLFEHSEECPEYKESEDDGTA